MSDKQVTMDEYLRRRAGVLPPEQEATPTGGLTEAQEARALELVEKKGYTIKAAIAAVLTPPGNAGAGTATPPEEPPTMDEWIRRKAGVIR